MKKNSGILALLPAIALSLTACDKSIGPSPNQQTKAYECPVGTKVGVRMDSQGSGGLLDPTANRTLYVECIDKSTSQKIRLTQIPLGQGSYVDSQPSEREAVIKWEYVKPQLAPT